MVGLFLEMTAFLHNLDSGDRVPLVPCMSTRLVKYSAKILYLYFLIPLPISTEIMCHKSLLPLRLIYAYCLGENIC